MIHREDEVRGVAGRAAGVRERPLVEQRDVGLTQPGQVVGKAVADDPRADDHHAAGRAAAAGKSLPPGPWILIYQMQVRSVNGPQRRSSRIATVPQAGAVRSVSRSPTRGIT